jgi:tripartite-type tricarboxylate transporter receptor subunit TctC
MQDRVNVVGILNALVLAAASTFTIHGHAQSYPAKPVRFILPIAVGTAPDAVTRFVSERLGAKLGVQVLVENRPSAGLIIGTDQVAKAAPDGYTLLSTLTTHVQVPSLYKTLPFDTLRDFAPITHMVNVDTLFLVRADLPVKDVKEFFALAKSTPNQLSYGSTGAGQSYHLNASALSRAAGVELLHVPYKGAVDALNELVAGRIDATFGSIPTSLGQIKAGRIRPLAAISLKRNPRLPDVPTFAELNVPILPAWFGLLAPRATPDPVIRKIQAEVRDIILDPAFAQRFASEGLHVIASSPEEFATKLSSDVAAWRRIIDAAGIKAE